MKVGDRVLTKFARKKEMYNNVFAEVVAFKNKGVRVKILTGPACGELKECSGSG